MNCQQKDVVIFQHEFYVFSIRVCPLGKLAGRAYSYVEISYGWDARIAGRVRLECSYRSRWEERVRVAAMYTQPLPDGI